uniref:Uncharacterized protein n=1 Tax=Meloidogyne hapla TaxID=6305 RepID=A0A1I8AXE7_MELHA
MPVFSNNRSPNPKRNALSTPSDPRTDPRPKKMEDIRECQPKIFYAQWNNQNLLSIIGPNDIRKR